MIFLVDNGSVRPEAYQNLCTIAAQISAQLGMTVMPAPLLHANKIPASELGGAKPVLLEDALKDAYDLGQRKFTILPLFFGPSGGIFDYLPRRLEIVSKSRPGFAVRTLDPLFKDSFNGGDLLTEVIEQRVTERAAASGIQQYTVVLVDHGSPKPEVTVVRDFLAASLAARFEPWGIAVFPASMERRPGKEYDFNEPLLENALKTASRMSNTVIVAQLFLSPGRHAGEGGDIADICTKAENEDPNLRILRTELVGGHPKLLELLIRRWREREGNSWRSF
jgi:sirohydrochlorin ferrochelatase